MSQETYSLKEITDGFMKEVREFRKDFMNEVKELRADLNDHKQLITTQSSLNVGRDHEISNMATSLKELHIEVRTMRLDFDERIGEIQKTYSERMSYMENSLKFFKFKVTFIVGVVAAIGAYLLEKGLSYFFGL